MGHHDVGHLAVFVLLLETSDPVHIDRMEAPAESSSLLLICRELLLVQRLKSNAGLANTDDDYATTFPSSRLVVLIGEGNMDFRNVVGRVRWG